MQVRTSSQPPPASRTHRERRAFHSITLGCKLNQFDTAGLEGVLRRRGWTTAESPETADLVLVNTCTVTHKADAEARKIIRGVRRRNAHCRIVVTGCYAEREAEAVAAMDGVAAVFGNRDKPRFDAVLDALGLGEHEPAAADPFAGDRGCDDAASLPDALHFGDRARAFLKIQEGCNLACSYCIIPEVRGRSRSVRPGTVGQALEALIRSGYREIVLTGVNTGDYGKDLRPRRTLAGLLRDLLDRPGRFRLRLNSLEPRTVTAEIVRLLASEPRLAPHLQVPLQSGSDRILRAMRRNYTVGFYRRVLEGLREAVPNLGLGADVIVGFPGETEEAFDETYRFLESSPLNYLHVFSWSPRPGTPASELPDRVPERIVRERSTVLRSLADRLSRRFRRSLEGTVQEAVVLDRLDGGRLRLLTGNFVEVLAPAGPAPPERGSLVSVRIAGGDASLGPSRPAALGSLVSHPAR